MKNTQSKGFTLIEILIVITIIGVLAALAASALGAFGGAKSRDAVRVANLQQVGTVLGSLQSRFHVPPFTGSGKYPEECKTEGAADLQGCFQALKISDDASIINWLTDPKQGAAIGQTEHQYYYAASTDGFKVCAHLEDQGAFEYLNADESGVITSSLSTGDETANMHCVVQGKNIEDVAATAIAVTE